jgi:hypothetical protein
VPTSKQRIALDIDLSKRRKTLIASRLGRLQILGILDAGDLVALRPSFVAPFFDRFHVIVLLGLRCQVRLSGF